MGIVRQQTILIILFAAAIVLKLFVGGLAWKNSHELALARQWSQHSETVSDKARLANQMYKEADLCGRLELAGMNHCDKEIKRAAAFDLITQVRAMVADSKAQMENLDAFDSAIRFRFEIQDKAVAANKTASGTIILPAEVSVNLSQATASVERAFNNFEAQEYAYLRMRHSDLNVSETRFNRAVAYLIVLSIITSSCFAYFGRRTLHRAKQTIIKLQKQSSKQPNKDLIVMTKEEHDELIQILRGENV